MMSEQMHQVDACILCIMSARTFVWGVLVSKHGILDQVRRFAHAALFERPSPLAERLSGRKQGLRFHHLVKVPALIEMPPGKSDQNTPISDEDISRPQKQWATSMGGRGLWPAG